MLLWKFSEILITIALTLRGRAKVEAVIKTGQFKYSPASSSLIYVPIVL